MSKELQALEGWDEKILYDLAEYHNGAAFKPKDWVEDGLPIVRIEQINKPNSETDKFNGFVLPRNLIDTGDLIFSWSATLKVIIWSGGPAVLNQHLYKVVPNNGVNKQLLLQILDFNMEKLAGQSQGSTMKHVTRKELTKFKVKFPLNENRQEKIATILRTVDDTIEQTEALIEKYSLVKAGMLHDLFTRGLTPDGKLRPPREEAPDLYKDTPIGWIPTEWEQPELQDICGHLITYGIVQAGPHIEGGVPYIRTGDMSGESLVKDKMLRTSRKIANAFKRSEVKAGEIVCAIRATVGKVLIVPEELDGANLTQGTARIAPKDDVDNRFVAWGFRSSAVQKSIMLCIKGTTFNEITLGDLRELPFSIPSTEHEQALIADRLDQCQHLVDAESSKLAKLQKEKKGLMHDLLTGVVPVKVDNPEVAHV